jgi:hypothetical protein
MDFPVLSVSMRDEFYPLNLTSRGDPNLDPIYETFDLFVVNYRLYLLRFKLVICLLYLGTETLIYF